MNYTITIENNLSKEDRELFNNAFRIYNESKIGKQEYTPVNYIIKKDGEVVGGVNAGIIWGWLMIDELFVLESYR